MGFHEGSWGPWELLVGMLLASLNSSYSQLPPGHPWDRVTVSILSLASHHSGGLFPQDCRAQSQALTVTPGNEDKVGRIVGSAPGPCLKGYLTLFNFLLSAAPA